ncbi:ATP-binding cassette domain-containing protein [Bradyrhizobium sp. LMTR 3]|uniref:ATP-binding cassette domain-containing protein n=1 Tax=Bradyrhizobium sp. LMTR 3 TaxID=189873 RepID=UPI0032E380F5
MEQGGSVHQNRLTLFTRTTMGAHNRTSSEMRDNGRPPTLAVDLREVMIRFGAFIAVKSMNLQVGDAEFVAVVGPTGCGKSTILNTVTGLFKHSSETFRSSASRSRD